MMVLSDVFNDAIQECSKSSQLINDTNEFYGNQVTSNGIIYSIQLHSCVIDGAFLSLFTTFEHFLEESFICYMMGQTGLNGNSFSRFVSPQSEEQARNMLKGISRFTDFTNRDTIVKLANNYFDGGGTYSYLNAISSDFENMKIIRNAISHISLESKRAFQGLVRSQLGSFPANMTTAVFLNATNPSSSSTFFIYYRDTIVSAINNISNP